MWQMTCFALRHMFGIIKRIFRKAEPARAVAPSVAVETAAASAASMSSLAPPPLPGDGGTKMIHLPKPASPANGDYLSLSYVAILRQMPKELFGRLAPEGLTGSFFMVPRQQVVEQLPQGAVKVPFGELRRAAPLGVFTNNSSHDGQMVDLPLAEIIPQMPADAYRRRTPEHTLVPPEEVTDIFGPKGQCLSELRVVPKNEAARRTAGPAAFAPGVTPLPGLGTTPGTGRVPVTPRPSAPTAPTSYPARTTPPRTAASTPAANPNSYSAPAPMPAVTPSVRAVAPVASPVNPIATGAKPLPRPLPKSAGPASAISTAPAKVPNFNPAPESTELRASPFLVELGELATEWPEAVREEIAQLPIPHVCVELPPAVVCEGLKRGQVCFNWGELRAWVVGAPPVATPSVNNSTELDLPLNVLTPLFLDYIRATQLNRKVASAEHITEFFRRASLQRAHQSAQASQPATPVVAAMTVSATDDNGAMSVSLSLVSAGWSEAILHEIQQNNLSDARMELPLAAVEAKLKTGKVDLSWRQLATWIPGCPPAVLGSPHGATVVNLPLSVVAPMFLKKRNGAASPRPPLSDLGIPDVFTTPGKPAPEDAPAPPPPAAAAPVPAVPAPVAPEPRQRAANLAELFGEPGKKSWTPKELVQGVARLPGVAGSLIALQDGLLVAHAMPASWKTEAMAAFLPQIFGRINQYGKELNTGEAKAVAITTGVGTIQVYHAGIVYLAALGDPGASLPLDDLQLVAGELSRRSQ